MPAPRLRKYLSAPGLLSRVRQAFDKIADHRQRTCHYALSDVLMSALAMFGLKYPSLLKFDEGRNEKLVRHNLKTLYGVAQAPCDTQMREILDAVPAARLRGAFHAVHQQLRRDKVLAAYQFLDGRYVLSLDGTGQFASDTVSCPECCVKHRQGGESY